MAGSCYGGSVGTSAGGSTAAAADAVGRGTPAGRLLHALYGGDKINGRATGSRYTKGNAKTRAELSKEGVNAPDPQVVVAGERRRKIIDRLCKERKAQKIAPKLGTFQSKYGWVGHDDVPAARRGPVHTSVRIVDRAALKREAEAQKPMPPMAGKPMGGKATERLQLEMEWARRGGFPKELDPDAPHSLYAGAAAKAKAALRQHEINVPSGESLEDLESLFEMITKEIEEREQFMAEISQLDVARCAQVAPQIDREISHRQAQLKKLHAKICAEEDSRLHQQQQR